MLPRCRQFSKRPFPHHQKTIELASHGVKCRGSYYLIVAVDLKIIVICNRMPAAYVIIYGSLILYYVALCSF